MRLEVIKLDKCQDKNWSVRENPDHEHAQAVRKALLKNGGYCPCAVERNDATKCACDKFVESCTNPNWFGQCDCGLYEKVRI